MFDDEIYDPVLEQLEIMSGYLGSINQLLKEQVKIETTNNRLLRKMMTELNKKMSDDTDNNLNKDWDKYANKNLLIINASCNESLNVAKKITQNMKGKFVKSSAKKDSELAAIINSLSDGDVIFIDASEPTFDEKMGMVIHDCVKDNCINISIGKGNTERSIRLDVPEIFFIVTACMEEFLPLELKDLLLLVE